MPIGKHLSRGLALSTKIPFVIVTKLKIVIFQLCIIHKLLHVGKFKHNRTAYSAATVKCNNSCKTEMKSLYFVLSHLHNKLASSWSEDATHWYSGGYY
jgi:hypothetical protein